MKKEGLTPKRICRNNFSYIDYLFKRNMIHQATDHRSWGCFSNIYFFYIQRICIRVFSGSDDTTNSKIQTGNINRLRVSTSCYWLLFFLLFLSFSVFSFIFSSSPPPLLFALQHQKIWLLLVQIVSHFRKLQNQLLVEYQMEMVFYSILNFCLNQLISILQFFFNLAFSTLSFFSSLKVVCKIAFSLIKAICCLRYSIIGSASAPFCYSHFRTASLVAIFAKKWQKIMYQWTEAPQQPQLGAGKECIPSVLNISLEPSFKVY